MWSWKPAKQILDALFAAAELVIAGRDSGFQRLFDVPERVLPRDILDAPIPRQSSRSERGSRTPSGHAVL
jgi:uncharacterized protein YcaQ